MENPEPRSNARLAASIVLVAVIGASLLGAVYLGNGAGTTASSSTNVTTSHSESSLTAEAADSSLGLKLALSINSTTIPSQDGPTG
jgi:hypothetical protein